MDESSVSRGTRRTAESPFLVDVTPQRNLKVIAAATAVSPSRQPSLPPPPSLPLPLPLPLPPSVTAVDIAATAVDVVQSFKVH
uniref:Uncharacterized protein n=1 Tax=Syphacia muris TaxID=451379 RepID=A0A0N5AYZ7_9BILA